LACSKGLFEHFPNRAEQRAPAGLTGRGGDRRNGAKVNAAKHGSDAIFGDALVGIRHGSPGLLDPVLPQLGNRIVQRH
jgi:hypothetical protein